MKKIFNILTFLSLSLICFSSYGQSEPTTLYLVRHAEKVQDADDPVLSDVGLKRAEKLANILKDVELVAVYSSRYKRTQQTARPIADQKKLQIRPYDASRQDGLARRLPYLNKGKSSLIVGHSNTLPTLLNLLTNTQDYEQFSDEDYGKLFIVKIYTDGEVTVKEEVY